MPLTFFRPGATPAKQVGEAAPNRPGTPPLDPGSPLLFRPGQQVDPARLAAMRATLIKRRYPEAPAELVELLARYYEAGDGLDPETLQLLARLVPGRTPEQLLQLRDRYRELRRFHRQLDQLAHRRRPPPPPPPADDDPDDLPF